MGSIPQLLLRHEVTVEPYEGDGAYGPVYGDPVTIPAFVDAQTTMVRDADGVEVVSSTTVYAVDVPDLPIGSRITYAGRELTALAVKRRDGGGLPTPDHVQIDTT